MSGKTLNRIRPEMGILEYFPSPVEHLLARQGVRRRSQELVVNSQPGSQESPMAALLLLLLAGAGLAAGHPAFTKPFRPFYHLVPCALCALPSPPCV